MQIEDHKLYFRERAQSKCGSFDYFDHIPGGGEKKVQCKLCLLLYSKETVDLDE